MKKIIIILCCVLIIIGCGITNSITEPDQIVIMIVDSVNNGVYRLYYPENGDFYILDDCPIRPLPVVGDEVSINLSKMEWL